MLADLVEHLAARRTDWTRMLAMLGTDHNRMLDGRRPFAIIWLDMLRPGGCAGRRNPRAALDQQAERFLAPLA